MVYFCADDYGVSVSGNARIENCLKNGILNKTSVLPNGEIADLKERLSDSGAILSLHINLVEGYPLSDSSDVDLLVSENGSFKYSFAGVFLLSLSPKRKRLEQQIYREIQSQVKFWKTVVGGNVFEAVDSHQHTHMIPLVFKTLMRVIKDESIEVKCMRIPAEPVMPYVLTPSLYTLYTLSGFAKQWILKILGFINRRELIKSKIPFTYFIGAMFSGRVNETVVKKLLPAYIKLSGKTGRDIELALHPAHLKNGEKMMAGSKIGFHKFYFSDWRNKEYEFLMSYNKKHMKEGFENALY